MNPTDKQLQYLKRLGYKGPPPQTKAEASAAIDAMKEGTGTSGASKAIAAQRKQTAKKEKKQRADGL